MKKNSAIFTLLIFLCAINAHAQSSESKTYNNLFQFSPFHFFASTFYLSYERAFPELNSALRISPFITVKQKSSGYYYGYGETFYYDYSPVRKEVYALEVAYKWFTFENPRKFNIFLSPYAQYKYISRQGNADIYNEIGEFVSDGNTINNVIGFGIDSGLRFAFGRFVMDFTLGGGMRLPLNETDYISSDMFSDTYRGVVPRGNFLLGMTF
ncbi:MAG: hypothetical protein LBU90_08405 [Bacteroidales bacterium]|jgi:hypothetical protein|nr:hypothetical protein [Bacteroidales bacterium]